MQLCLRDRNCHVFYQVLLPIATVVVEDKLQRIETTPLFVKVWSSEPRLVLRLRLKAEQENF